VHVASLFYGICYATEEEPSTAKKFINRSNFGKLAERKLRAETLARGLQHRFSEAQSALSDRWLKVMPNASLT
jgi:hypothetical protein